MNYLIKQGLSLLEANIRYKLCWIDLIMKDGREWIFIEVKYRSKAQYGQAINALNTMQIGLLKRADKHFIPINKVDAVYLLDLVSIDAGQV